MKKNKKYCISIICDNEVLNEVIDAFKFKDVEYKKVQTGTVFGTEIVIEIKKELL